jgi:hypothetical protein
MTDRDHFAAAALSGLLASDQYDQLVTPADYADTAYELADAMLRERERTNHDAAPAARAQVDAAGISRQGTGNPVEPVAWATFYPNGSTASVYVGRQPQHAEPLYPIVPLYRQPQPTLTDAEREAVRYMIAAGKFGQRDEALTEEHAAILRGLLERLGGDE